MRVVATNILSLSRQRQSGAALLVSLMILLVISLIGVAAMKTSLFNTKISSSSQAAVMAFNGAEAAISAVLLEVRQDRDSRPNHMVSDLMLQIAQGSQAPVLRCYTDANMVKVGACAATDFMDSRGLVQAYSSTVMTGVTSGSETGSQVSSSGGTSGTRFGMYGFMTGAAGKVPVLNVEQFTVQEFATKALVVSGEM